MLSDKSSSLEDFKNKIRVEVQNVTQNPLTYDTNRLIDLLDDLELDPHIQINDYSIHFAAVHLLAFIINQDFVNAKHLWKRLPENYRKDEKLKTILVLLKAAIQDNYAEIITHIQTAEKSYSNAEDIKALLRASILVIRSHIMRKVTRDFINLPLKDIARYLALTAEQAKEVLSKNGWKMIDNDLIQTPEKLEISDREFRNITEAQFKNLSQTICFLETI